MSSVWRNGRVRVVLLRGRRGGAFYASRFMADYGGIFRQVRLGIMSFGDGEVSMRSGRVGVSCV
jgi:hypothetical protein